MYLVQKIEFRTEEQTDGHRQCVESKLTSITFRAHVRGALERLREFDFNELQHNTDFIFTFF